MCLRPWLMTLVVLAPGLRSIVIALGITEITTPWVRMIRRRERVRFHALYVFASATILFLMTFCWWGLWEARAVEVWTIFPLSTRYV